MAKDDLKRNLIREELEFILLRGPGGQDGITALGLNTVSSAMRDVLSSLYPLTRQDEEAQQARQRVNQVQQDTLAGLVETLMPPTVAEWGAYRTIAKNLVPVLDGLCMTDVDAQAAKTAQKHLVQFKAADAEFEARLPEFDGPIAPEASSCGPLLNYVWKELPMQMRNIKQAISMMTGQLNGQLAMYLASYTNILEIAKNVVGRYHRESEKNVAKPADAMDATLDYIEAFALPISEMGAYPQKLRYLHTVLDRARKGYSAESLNRWASDVRYGLQQKSEQMSENDAYAAADRLLEFTGKLPETDVEFLRTSLRDGISIGLKFDDAREYTTLCWRLKDQPEQREKTMEVIQNVTGAYHLPYSFAAKVAEGDRAKRTAGLEEEVIASWIGMTIFAAQRGCDYATAQHFVDAVTARTVDGRTLPADEEERAWRNTYALNVGAAKLLPEIAETVADAHHAVSKERGLSIADDWAVAVSFALRREVPYDAAAQFGEMALKYVGNYANKTDWLNWQRIAFDHMQNGGMALDAAAQKAYDETQHLNGNGKPVSPFQQYVGANIAGLMLVHDEEERNHAP